MNIHNTKLLISAVSPKQYPASVVPEIALAGRSNVGKSSFINKLLNRKNFARTSSHPGKTATINFYDIDSAVCFVDLPGYGYAEVSKKEREKWAVMINTYLETRPQLCAVFLLVDARHKPTKDDISMFAWLKSRYDSAVVIATKTDKIAKTKLPEHINTVRETLCLTQNDILIPFSGETGMGREEAWDVINSLTGQEEN
ncbi:MAG: YihA family ribosome biogenesis GTP-binding protein [Clostridia bacterium]|nr:YihA family ribosome biogenesis GTP-binding protein [Clostridia bacterium]